GLGAASHTDVAREAGVSVPAVFFYFRTRALLVDAVLDEVAGLYLGLAEQHLRPDAPTPQALLDFARAFARSVDEQPDHARVWLDWSTAIRDELWPRYLEFQERVIGAIAAALERGRHAGSVAADADADDEARLFVGAAYVVTQMKFAGTPPAKVERFLETLVRSAVGRYAAGRAGSPAARTRSPR
ncbi:MAG: TetR/AcrR family transcriptional regulator, partial [Thermodesulfobacteriota bacterium]